MDDKNAPSMEMRALLAVVLSMLVLTVYQYFYAPPLEEPPVAEAPAPSQAVAPAEAASAVEATTAAPELGAAQGEQEQPDLVGAEARRITVRTANYEATLTSVGGVLERLVLTGFQETPGGEAVDLVHPLARSAGALPLRLSTPAAPEQAAAANAATYVVDVQGGRSDGSAWVAEPDSPVRVTLQWRAAGWDVTKTLDFQAEGYQVPLTVSARAPSGAAVYVALGPGLNRVDPSSSNTWLCECAVVNGPEGAEHLAADDVEGSADYAGNVRWAGVESHYFLGAFLLEGASAVRIDKAAYDETPLDGAQAASKELLTTEVLLAGPTGLALYLGPKKYDVLAAQGHDLTEVIDFGMFWFVAQPMLALLNWIDSYAGNYGLAIILLTVLLRLVFLPLNHRAMVSMRKTQKLQPKMAAIRAKYKGAKEIEQRQKMNEEVMELYRREGVSPFGGCLPMLAQLPILFAFYGMLSVAIELRGAPFALWIQDLSKHDPYLVLPLLMGGSMIVQQRMTPTSGINPAQARMMNLMPIMFTVLFLYVPSGLVLYWLVNNLLGIAQQVYVMRRMEEPAPATRAPKRGGKSQRGKK